MRQDDRARAGGLHRGEDVQQEGKIAVLGGRFAIVEAAVFRLRRQPCGPGLGREGRVGDDEVEGLEAVGVGKKVWFGDDIALRDLGRGAVVHDHVHAREATGGDVHFLPEDGDRHTGGLGGLQEKGARAAGRVIDGLLRAGGAADARHGGNDPRDLGRGIELPL